MKKHIILDSIFSWSFCLVAVAFGIWQGLIQFIILGTILFAYVFMRTFRWFAFVYDKVFDKILSVKTVIFKYKTFILSHISGNL